MNFLTRTSLMLMAAAAVTLTSCSTDENFLETQQTTNAHKGLTLVAGMPGLNGAARTDFEMEGNKYVPLWSQGYFISDKKMMPDALYAIFKGQTRVYRFNKPDATPVRFSSFEEYIPEGQKSLKEDLATVDDTTKVYFIKNNSYEDWYSDDFDKRTAHFIPRIYPEERIASANDFLSSKPLTAGELKNNEQTSVNLSFKRLSAFIIVNLIPEKGFENPSRFQVGAISLSTHATSYEDGPDLFGESIIDLEKGELVSKYDDILFQEGDDKVADIYNTPMMIPGDKKHPGLLFSKPYTFKEGEKLYITLRDMFSHEMFTKELTAGKDGIKFEAGKVTTLNIKVKESDFTAFGIIQDTAGTLTEEAFEKALINSYNANYYLDLKGSFNAQDIEVIRTALKKTSDAEHPSITLSMTSANLVGGGTYKGPNGEDIKMEDNTITQYMFWGLPRLQQLFIPLSVKYIRDHAIGKNDNLTFLSIEGDVDTIEKDAIGFVIPKNNNATHQLNFLIFPKKPDNIAHGFFNSGSEYTKLRINGAWGDEGLGKEALNLKTNTWKSVKWKEFDPY